MGRINEAVYAAENYATSIIASSVGLNEAVGAAGLITLGIRGAVNAVALRRFESQMKDTALLPAKREQIQEKLQKLKQTRRQDAKTAKAMAFLLVPIVGGILARRFGDLTGAYASAVSEVISLAGANETAHNLAKNGAYPLSGGKYDARELDDPSIHTYLEGKNAEDRLDMHRLLSHGTNKVEELKIKTKDGREISATYAQAVDSKGNPVSEKGPTAILFHGNGMLKESMTPIAQFYQDRGINVLLITMGGYGDSARGTETTELTTYHDAQAAVNYLKATKGIKQNDQILAHGISMGGSLAVFSGKNNPGLHVVADQTFASFRDVSVNTVINHICANLLSGVNPTKPLKDFKNVVFEGAVRKYFPKDVKDEHGLRDIQGKKIKTDALDNRQKVRKLKGSLFAIKSSHDHLMGWDKNKQGKFENNFADKLVDAYYTAQKKTNKYCKKTKNDMVAEIVGGHSTLFINNLEAVEKLSNHLEWIGFVPTSSSGSVSK